MRERERERERVNYKGGATRVWQSGLEKKEKKKKHSISSNPFRSKPFPFAPPPARRLGRRQLRRLDASVLRQGRGQVRPRVRKGNLPRGRALVLWRDSLRLWAAKLRSSKVGGLAERPGASSSSLRRELCTIYIYKERDVHCLYVHVISPRQSYDPESSAFSRDRGSYQSVPAHP